MHTKVKRFQRILSQHRYDHFGLGLCLHFMCKLSTRHNSNSFNSKNNCSEANCTPNGNMRQWIFHFPENYLLRIFSAHNTTQCLKWNKTKLNWEVRSLQNATDRRTRALPSRPMEKSAYVENVYVRNVYNKLAVMWQQWKWTLQMRRNLQEIGNSGFFGNLFYSQDTTNSLSIHNLMRFHLPLIICVMCVHCFCWCALFFDFKWRFFASSLWQRQAPLNTIGIKLE